MATLGEEYPKMQARVREILVQYRKIGPAGLFGATMIENLLQRADKAAIEQDLSAMIQIYKEMEKVK